VIEDAAHAFPAYYKGRPVGTIGDLTCFSFYATKTLAMGEGGAVVTDNDGFIRSIKINRLHGINRDAWDRYTMKGSWYYEVVDNGHKYNSTDLNAAMGLSQLKKAEFMLNRRKQIAKSYMEYFKAHPHITLPVIKEDRETAWHLFVIRVNNRDELIDALKGAGVGTSVHFIPVHKHPYYKNRYGYLDSNYPASNEVFKGALSLPIYPSMTDEEVAYVANKVIEYAR